MKLSKSKLKSMTDTQFDALCKKEVSLGRKVISKLRSLLKLFNPAKLKTMMSRIPGVAADDGSIDVSGKGIQRKRINHITDSTVMLPKFKAPKIDLKGFADIVTSMDTIYALLQESKDRKSKNTAILDRTYAALTAEYNAVMEELYNMSEKHAPDNINELLDSIDDTIRRAIKQRDYTVGTHERLMDVDGTDFLFTSYYGFNTDVNSATYNDLLIAVTVEVSEISNKEFALSLFVTHAKDMVEPKYLPRTRGLKRSEVAKKVNIILDSVESAHVLHRVDHKLNLEDILPYIKLIDGFLDCDVQLDSFVLEFTNVTDETVKQTLLKLGKSPSVQRLRRKRTDMRYDVLDGQHIEVFFTRK